MHFLREVADWLTDPAHWHGPNGIPVRVGEHVGLSAVALAVALIVAVPIGLALGHRGRGGFLAVNVGNIGRAIPSIAILIIGAAWLGIGGRPGLFGIGAKPALLALVVLGIPPVLTNTYTATASVDADVKDAARGMGMTGRQVLWRVEVPAALPLMFAGVRTSGSQIVATATLAAYIGWGGLGTYIVKGIALDQAGHAEVFAGALLVVALAFAVDLALGALQRAVSSPGVRLERQMMREQMRVRQVVV